MRDDNPEISNSNKWQLPGGGSKNSESIYTTIGRELEEEVTYVPKDLKYLGWRVRRNGIAQYFFLYFAKSKDVHNFKLGKTEGQAIKFYSINDMLKLDLVLYFRRFILKNRKVLEKTMLEKKYPSSEDLGLSK